MTARNDYWLHGEGATPSNSRIVLGTMKGAETPTLLRKNQDQSKKKAKILPTGSILDLLISSSFKCLVCNEGLIEMDEIQEFLTKESRDDVWVEASEKS